MVLVLLLFLAHQIQHALQSPPMFGRYWVYMVQSSSRRALYIGFTSCLVPRVIEHRVGKYPGSFTSKYRTWRLVYYEECGDADAAKDRERQLKGWSRTKKNGLIAKMNPKWRDLMLEFEEKYGLEFRLDGRIVAKLSQNRKTETYPKLLRQAQDAQDPSTSVSHARPT